jgi:hypothetical protein
VVDVKKLIVLLLSLISSSQLFPGTITWSSPPTTISGISVTSSEPQVVVDSNGNTTAAWVEGGVVKAATLPYGGSWSSTSTLSGASSSSLNLAIDNSGNIAAAWVQSGVVKAASKPFNGSWSAASSVSSSGASLPVLGMNSSGDAVLVWKRNDTIEASSKLLNLIWGIASVLSPNNSSNPHLGVGTDGTVMAVWSRVVNGVNVIQSSKAALIGAVWGAAKTVSQSSSPSDYPKVAIDGLGNATAIWFEYSLSGSAYSNVELVGAGLTSAASNWSTPVIINSTSIAGGLLNPANLISKIQADNSGNVGIMWSTSDDGSTLSMQAAVKPFGADWTSQFRSTSGDPLSLSGDLTTTSNGETFMALMASSSGTINILAQEADISSALFPNQWSFPQTLSNEFNNGYPKVASALNGTTMYAACVWINSDNGTNVIQAATGTKTTVLPPSNVQITQDVEDFGVVQNYYNTVTWTASSDPGLAGYVVYRDGTFWTTTEFNVTSVIDNNAVQNGPVTYGVAAYDNDGHQSAIIMENFP